jgi:hypothetical protein
VDEVEAQEILERIEEDLEIPGDIVHELDKEQFSALIETWAEIQENKTDRPSNFSERFFDKLDKNR